MSKRLISSLIIISFIGIAIFGFTAIGTPACIAKLSAGGVCLAHTSAWNQVAFYLSSFKSFSSGIFQFALGLLILFFALSLSIFINNQQKLFSKRLGLYQEKFAKLFLPLRQKLNHWLALYQFS